MKILLTIIFLSSSLYVHAIDTLLTGFKIPIGGVPTVINAHGLCKIITNNRAQQIFVPTKLAAEFNSFIANPPASVTVVSCCAGYEYGGLCYYRGGFGASCTSVCSARGGCNTAGLSYTGYGGSVANCKAVLDGLLLAPIGGEPWDLSATAVAPYNAMGCSLVDGAAYGLYRYYNSGVTTTCAAAEASYSRICACNN